MQAAQTVASEPVHHPGVPAGAERLFQTISTMQADNAPQAAPAFRAQGGTLAVFEPSSRRHRRLQLQPHRGHHSPALPSQVSRLDWTSLLCPSRPLQVGACHDCTEMAGISAAGVCWILCYFQMVKELECFLKSGCARQASVAGDPD